MTISCCRFHEQDALQCGACLRWFCFGCTSLSLQTLPAGLFLCPECCGIDTYDEQLARKNELVRERIKEGQISHMEVRDSRHLLRAICLDNKAGAKWRRGRRQLSHESMFMRVGIHTNMRVGIKGGDVFRMRDDTYMRNDIKGGHVSHMRVDTHKK